ncbi:hypothetical protein TNCV_3644291 [Trichonephila clavipes]|nr:hypothetical protein TNCV_3644291 [Trichonephila clavipes]
MDVSSDKEVGLSPEMDSCLEWNEAHPFCSTLESSFVYEMRDNSSNIPTDCIHTNQCRTKIEELCDFIWLNYGLTVGAKSCWDTRQCVKETTKKPGSELSRLNWKSP